MKTAVIVNAQFLIELPEDISHRDAEDYGVDWLTAMVGNTDDILDYRHPKLTGVYLRPVPVQIKNMELEEIFEDGNLIQL